MKGELIGEVICSTSLTTYPVGTAVTVTGVFIVGEKYTVNFGKEEGIIPQSYVKLI